MRGEVFSQKTPHTAILIVGHSVCNFFALNPHFKWCQAVPARARHGPRTTSPSGMAQAVPSLAQHVASEPCRARAWHMPGRACQTVTRPICQPQKTPRCVSSKKVSPPQEEKTKKISGGKWIHLEKHYYFNGSGSLLVEYMEKSQKNAEDRGE